MPCLKEVRNQEIQFTQSFSESCRARESCMEFLLILVLFLRSCFGSPRQCCLALVFMPLFLVVTCAQNWSTSFPIGLSHEETLLRAPAICCCVLVDRVHCKEEGCLPLNPCCNLSTDFHSSLFSSTIGVIKGVSRFLACLWV